MTRVALLQMRSGIEPAANARRIVAAIEEAAAGGARLLFTPEMVGLLDRDRKRATAVITTAERDIVLSSVKEAAAKYGIWVSVGSLAIADERADGRLSNRSFLIDDKGNVRTTYDKIHLFDVDLPSGESWRESAAYVAGEQLVLADTPAGTLGLSICYDVRFPDQFQALSAAGAQILSVPAAFTVPTGKAHWHVLLRARAIENACWVVAAAQSGVHADGRETYGHSLVVDPWGEVVLDMGEGEGLAFAEIDLGKEADARARIPVIAHRRALSEVARVS